MCKKVLLLAVLALALPMAAFASGGIDFHNSGGTLSGSASGLSLTGSTLIGVTGLYGDPVATNLGSVSLTTGALTSGNLQTGGWFAGGGSFTVVGNGTNGVPNAVIFSGTFIGPVEWTAKTLPNGVVQGYVLSGVLTGTLNNGYSASGITSQVTFKVSGNHKGYFMGTVTVGSGDTTVVVPEPGTLSLFGTGLVGLAGLVRRKLNLV
jgi:hypothetical protein